MVQVESMPYILMYYTITKEETSHILHFEHLMSICNCLVCVCMQGKIWGGSNTFPYCSHQIAMSNRVGIWQGSLHFLLTCRLLKAS